MNDKKIKRIEISFNFHRGNKLSQTRCVLISQRTASAISRHRKPNRKLVIYPNWKHFHARILYNVNTSSRRSNLKIVIKANFRTDLLGNIPRAAKPHFLPIFGPNTPVYGSFRLHDMDSGIPFWQRSSSVCEVRFLNSWVILPNLLGT